MATKRTQPGKASGKDAPADPVTEKKKKKPEDGTRDTIEAVVIAFVLAFLFKTFEAEAFVIPTGSMAPTLYGRHKEITCESCGFHYDLGASSEVDQDSGILQSNKRIYTAVCPNCRNTNDVLNAPVFNGDRIVVNKQVAEFKRFHVTVFKNPEQPSVSYIKRCVGLPGESIRIRQGNIYARRSEDEPWRIQRKDDPEIQRAIQIPVYDDRFPSTDLLADGIEERWAPAELKPDSNDPATIRVGFWPETKNTWTRNPEDRTYQCQADNADLEWLRYRHILPTDGRWGEDRTRPIEKERFRAQLVADFCGFNPGGYSAIRDPQTYQASAATDEVYWVGDLTLNATVRIKNVQPESLLVLELVEGPLSFQCQINPNSGTLELYVQNRTIDPEMPVAELKGSAATQITGPGEYAIEFANVDDRICVWIDGDQVEFPEPVELAHADLELPTDADLAPVGIASRKLHAEVADLVLLRDIYYRNEFPRPEVHAINPRDLDNPESLDGFVTPMDRTYPISAENAGTRGLKELLHVPKEYGDLYAEVYKENEQTKRLSDLLTYTLGDDEYLMFGDNSPASLDSRLFNHLSRPVRGIYSHRYAVRRQDLIGEAMFIFWPHGKPFLNNGEGYTLTNHRDQSNKKVDYPFYRAPFYPNIPRMKVIY